MEATCQYVVGRWPGAYVDRSYVCGAPIPRLCGADGCRHWRSDHDETEIYNVLTPACYGAQRDGVACDIAHLYSPGPLASECARGHPVALTTWNTSGSAEEPAP